MKRFLDRLLDLLYPPRCALCRRFLREEETGVCRFCRKKHEGSGFTRDLPHVRFCAAPFRYEGQVRQSLLRYKFRGLTAYGAVYAEFQIGRAHV